MIDSQNVYFAKIRAISFLDFKEFEDLLNFILSLLGANDKILI